MLEHERVAEYRCDRCAHQWKQVAGVDWQVGTGRGTSCPACGSLYLTWTNHPLSIERNRK